MHPTCWTNLFQAGIDGQLILSCTGHFSTVGVADLPFERTSKGLHGVMNGLVPEKKLRIVKQLSAKNSSTAVDKKENIREDVMKAVGQISSSMSFKEHHTLVFRLQLHVGLYIMLSTQLQHCIHPLCAIGNSLCTYGSLSLPLRVSSLLGGLFSS